MADDGYRASFYRELRTTRSMKDMPRFGHSDSFASLFDSGSDGQTDYILGLLFAAVFILVLFVLWGILLLIFKCLGQKRVGFLSGSAFASPKDSKKPIIIRSVFLLSAFLILIFSGLSVTRGLNNIYNTVDTLIDSSREINKLMADADAVSATLESAGKNTRDTRDLLVTKLETGFCSGVSDLRNQTGIDFDATIAQILEHLKTLDDFHEDDFSELQSGLETVGDGVDDVDQYANDRQKEVSAWPKLLIIIPSVLFCTLFSLGAVLAWAKKDFKKYQCFLSYGVLPFFALFSILYFVLAALIVMLASTNADFCSGGEAVSPDGTFFDILTVKGFTEDDMTYRLVKFYVDTCKEGDLPVLFLGEYEEDLDAAFTTLQNLKFDIGNTTLARLEEICQEDIGPLNVLLTSLSSEITLLLAFAKSAIDLLACRRLAPIYTNTFYTGTCKYSIEGVSWAFTSFLLIAIFSFTMIMFRSSWLVSSNGMEYHDAENDYLGDEAVEVEYVDKDTKKEKEVEKFPDEELMEQDISMSC